MAQRTHYWSCSQLADWIRGTPKPSAQTIEGWDVWRKQAKAVHNFRYWVAEEGLDLIQKALWWPVDSLYAVKYYVNNRWITGTHCLTAAPDQLKRGQWCDVGNRFLPCLFNELVDFVEVEQAGHYIAWDKEARAKFNAPFYAFGWFRWRVWRCPEAGLAYLDWAKSLDNSDWLSEDEKHLAEPTSQALAAKEMLELYHWWKNVYPNRQDPHDLSGWSDWCDQRRQNIDLQHKEEQAESSRILDLCNEIEKQQEQEDTEMMIRLIKIRGHLWT